MGDQTENAQIKGVRRQKERKMKRRGESIKINGEVQVRQIAVSTLLIN